MTAQVFRSYGIVLGMSAVLMARPIAAQELPRPAVEVGAGWAGFVDESPVDHSTFGTAARVHLTPRVAVGPELTYMIGPGHDRDIYLLGNIFFEFLPTRTSLTPRAVPFVVAGGGLFQHRDRFVTRTRTYNNGTFVGGGGVRIAMTARVYVAPDFRIGLEDLHMRATVNVGVRLGT